MQALSRTLLLIACWAPWALGQDTDVRTYPKLEYFAGYSSIETNNHTFLFSEFKPLLGLDYDENGQGFDAEVIRNVSRYFSVVGDFSAHLSYNQFSVQQAKGTQNITINPELFNFLAGPEVKWRNHTRIAPFANTLFGLAHSTATLNTTGPIANVSSTDAETGFAMAFNGGFEFRLTRRVSLRGFLTYSQAFAGSDVLPRQRVDAVGWCVGILFH
jgi:opacity protein-like surface antigen